MPYITQDKRAELEITNRPETAGELNYCITMLLIDYLDRQGASYSTINDILGAVEGAKLEFYRRFASPYEDKKIIENGDVY
jgi:hypothetical protein